MLRIITILLLFSLTACFQNEYKYGLISPNNVSKREKIPQIDKEKQSLKINKKINVALILPLSGETAEIGKAMLDAAELAMFDKYANLNAENASIALFPKDSMGTKKGAILAAKSAKNADIILGPLYGNLIPYVIKNTSNKQIISFSNNKKYAGGKVFLLGFMPSDEVHKILGSELKNGIKNIAAIIPNNQYGTIIEHAIREEISLRSGVNLKITHYSDDTENFDSAIMPIIEDGNAEAILIAEGGEKLAIIAKRLRELGYKSHLLGTRKWDEYLIGNEDIIGEKFASTPLKKYYGFLTRFKNQYDYEPPKIAALAYDAVSLAIVIAEDDGDFSKKNLTYPNGWSGSASGLFRFLKDGTNQRELSIIQVGRYGFRETAPARREFSK